MKEVIDTFLLWLFYTVTKEGKSCSYHHGTRDFSQ